MGKSFELLGLATFNIILAMILSTTFLSGSNLPKLEKLTEDNVSIFLDEVASIASGSKKDMDSYAITSYFMGHISDDSLFKTTMQYSIDGMEDSSRELEMGKMSYISHVLQSAKMVNNYETLTKIDYVKVYNNGKRASAITTNYERGMMPMDDGSGTQTMVPIIGTSYCEQEIILSEDNIIQMAGAVCTTDLSFEDSF